MAYTWTTGEVITADKLNATGGGGDIFLLTFTLTEGNDGYEATCDKTFAEASAAYTEGKTIIARYAYDGEDQLNYFDQYAFSDSAIELVASSTGQIDYNLEDETISVDVFRLTITFGGDGISVGSISGTFTASGYLNT